VNVVAQQAADLLEKAIALLETKGWCAYQLEDEFGAHCAIGALQKASVNRTIAGFDPDSLLWRHQPEIALAIQALARPEVMSFEHAVEDVSSNWQRIVMWNNSQQTAEPVIDGMRRAAKELANNA